MTEQVDGRQTRAIGDVQASEDGISLSLFFLFFSHSFSLVEKDVRKQTLKGILNEDIT